MEILGKEQKYDSGQQLKIVFQRHGNYYKKEDTADTNLLGWLTPTGVAQTRENAKKMYERIIEGSNGHKVQFLFLNSPAKYLKIYGARAQQTAEVAAIELCKFSDESEIINLAKTERITRPFKVINEFYLDTSIEEALEKQYKGNFWELYYNMSDHLQQHNDKAILTETSIDISNRTRSALKIVYRFWRNYREYNPDKKFVTWCTTHGDVIRSFLQHGMGIGEKIKNWRSGYSEVFEFDVTDKGILSCDFQDKSYSIRL